MILKLNTYKFRKIAHLLKTGDAWIESQCSDPGPWPHGNIYWIINDSISQETHHVLACLRPTWQKYDKFANKEKSQ